MQILRWAEHEWPASRPCELKFRDDIPDVYGRATKESKKWFGVTYREGLVLCLYVSSRKCRTLSSAIDTTIHEYCHAYLWPHAKVEFSRPEHGPQFWTLYGEIMDRFLEDNGSSESKNFDIE